jgi:membrane protein YdbS with pleckstrin-like domain
VAALEITLANYAVTTIIAMPFPRRLLNDYETVVLDLHPHWWFFGWPAIATGATVIASLVVRAQLDGATETAMSSLLLALLVVSAAWLIVRLLDWRSTYFVVTSHRLIFRRGLLSRTGVEIPLEKINNVNFHQSIAERLLGCGDLIIESASEGGQSKFSDVVNPDRVQGIIHTAIQERLSTGPGLSPRSASTSPMDIADQLERLEGLRDRGVLTDAEFEDQKQRLLDS